MLSSKDFDFRVMQTKVKYLLGKSEINNLVTADHNPEELNA
jgi:hypothetical protein